MKLSGRTCQSLYRENLLETAHNTEQADVITIHWRSWITGWQPVLEVVGKTGMHYFISFSHCALRHLLLNVSSALLPGSVYQYHFF